MKKKVHLFELLQYARGKKDALFEDVGILRSLNANFRGEHR